MVPTHTPNPKTIIKLKTVNKQYAICRIRHQIFPVFDVWLDKYRWLVDASHHFFINLGFFGFQLYPATA